MTIKFGPPFQPNNRDIDEFPGVFFFMSFHAYPNGSEPIPETQFGMLLKDRQLL